MIGKNIRHRWKLWLNNIKMASRFDVLIEKAVTIKYTGSITFGNKTTLQSGVYLYGSRRGKKVVIGDHVVIGMNGVILGEGGVDIGEGTHFGPNVVLTTQYADRKATTDYSDTVLKYMPVSIGKGVWVGAGSVIMPGVVLGDFCTVAPNSVVFGKWGDNVSLVGNPAKKTELLRK
jgi:acetyltransferase-like isoleucine patch superfamily enzyme